MTELVKNLPPLNNSTNGVKISDDNLEILKGLDVTIKASIGEAQLSVKDFLELEKGNLVKLNTGLNQDIDLYVNENLVAKGSLVAYEDSFGIQITEII